MESIIHRDNNNFSETYACFTVRINDGNCEWEYYFKRRDGDYSIRKVAEAIARDLNAKLVGSRILKVNKPDWIWKK